jgi:hypothetical protein
MQVKKAPDGGVLYVVDPSGESLQAALDYAGEVHAGALGSPQSVGNQARPQAHAAVHPQGRGA